MLDDPDRRADPAAAVPRPSVAGAAWLGVKIGFRWMTTVFGPVFFLTLVAGLAPTLFGLGARRGFGLHRLALNGIGGYLLFAIWGVVIGATVGVVAALLARWRGRDDPGAWWADAMHRPVRLFPWRRAKADSVVRKPWPPWRGWSRWLGIPAVVVLAASFLAGVYAGWVVDRRLIAVLSATRRDDPSWELENLMAEREIVPDEEDGALVVAEVVAMLPDNWPDRPRPEPGVPQPPPSEIWVAFERFRDAAENVRLDDETADTLRAEMREQAEAVELARSVADYRSGWHYLAMTQNPMNISLQETGNARTAARLLQFDAALRAHEGDVDGALESCRAILGVGRSIGDEPTVMSGLVRNAIGGIARMATLRALSQGEPSDSALAAIQDNFLDEWAEPILIRGLRGERAMQSEMIRRISVGELPSNALSIAMREDGTHDDVRPVSPIGSWGKLIYDHQRVLSLEWMNELFVIVNGPSRERPEQMKAWEAKIDRAWKSWHGSFTAGLPAVMAPSQIQAESADTRLRCELAATYLLLAAERHRQRTGDWPESVAAIDPEILPIAPDDPFTDEPFLLTRRDGRIFIHSVGPNREDDGGEYDPRTWRNGGPDDAGSWAWDVPFRGQPSRSPMPPTE